MPESIDLVPIRRALLSVSDKTDLVPFARALIAAGAEIISTGGTAKALTDAGISVRAIDDLTGFPEMMDGRVKTLHPNVHAGLLALRDNPEHVASMNQHGIEPIDLVCVNLYPFESTITRAGVTQREAIEQIDIGGPSMIRSAAKNAAWVTVVTSPTQYDRVVSDLSANAGSTSLELRRSLASAAFARTSEYDAAISAYLARTGPVAFPPTLRSTHTKVDDLRYGENPHQRAALYRDPTSVGPSIVNARVRAAKQLSYNNILDASAALELVKALARLDPDRAGACVVKHTNPCGVALADSPPLAVTQAVAGDPLAAYGGILAINRELDAPLAATIAESGSFFEVVIAPEIHEDAAATLEARWKNIRLLSVGDNDPSNARKLETRSIPGGVLVQERDIRSPDPETWTLAAGPTPDASTLRDAAALVCAVRALSSNAIAIGGRTDANALRLFGAGAGQMDRVASCRHAIEKARQALADCPAPIAASDAFFPFPDGPQALIEAGVKTIIHPGGSKRDQETFELCEQHAVTCLITGVRHFRH
ncbi:MAG: bifunctional phosphoribosylaminoimidazolecarboxamide formyltransferase/IMP cyclohydrolase [Phycisphaerales bacterium JB059]